MSRIWWILTWALEILKISTFICSFCAKHITFNLKRYREIIFHNPEESCKFRKKTGLLFKKRHKEYGKFSPELLKVYKMGHWWDPFIQSSEYMSLKFTEELCVILWKMMQSLKGNWLVISKLTWGIWQILKHSKVSKTYTLMGSFWPKCMTIELKSTEEFPQNIFF